MTLLKRASLVAMVVTAVLTGGSIATADGPYEPNETAPQATGPIVGGTSYNGVIETSNDVDWFFFYVAGQRQFEVVLTWRSGPDCSAGVSLTLRNRDGSEEGTAYADGGAGDTVGRTTLTSPGSARYNLEVNGCEGAAYTIQITPADAFTTQPPTRCFNHVHTRVHKHRKRHRHRRRHRHANGRIHIHRRVHIHKRKHIHRRNHAHCVPAP